MLFRSPRYNEGGQYVEIFEYDKNGKLFWNSTWETQLESIEEYGSYSFDYEYEHINDELGEQLVKGYVKKNNSNIATITSNFI